MGMYYMRGHCVNGRQGGLRTLQPPSCENPCYATGISTSKYTIILYYTPQFSAYFADDL